MFYSYIKTCEVHSYYTTACLFNLLTLFAVNLNLETLLVKCTFKESAHQNYEKDDFFLCSGI